MEPDKKPDDTKHNVLVVDEDGENLEAFRVAFRSNYHLFSAASFAEALDILKNHDIHIALVDHDISGGKGIELLEEIVRAQPFAVGVLMATRLNPELLIEAANARAVYRFIAKPWFSDDMENLLAEASRMYRTSLERETWRERLEDICNYYREEIERDCGFEIIIGRDGDLAGIMEKIRQVARSRMPVLFRGEHGVGKELLARTLHRFSDRSGGPFVKIDPLSMRDGGVEESLFGRLYEDGNIRRSLVDVARGGTLFIENVDNLPREAQFRLVSLIKFGQYERVGDVTGLKVDTRVVATATGDLEKMAISREFRADLLEVLSEYSIYVPALRQRRRDLAALAAFFANRFSAARGMGTVRFGESVAEKITQYDWPGNLFEMRGVMKIALSRRRDGVIKSSDLAHLIYSASETPHVETSEPPPRQPVSESGGVLKDELDDLERSRILDALEKAGGKKARASRILGINRSTLYYRMKKLGIEN